MLFGAICSSIFRAIIEQAPFAIQDLLKELKKGGAPDSDSGQASEDEEEEEEEGEEDAAQQGLRAAIKATKQLNGALPSEGYSKLFQILCCRAATICRQKSIMKIVDDEFNLF